MASLRFPTVQDLYDAFPLAQDDVGIEPSHDGSLAFLKAQTDKEAWHPAISFCAYLLPRREGVWWGCQSLRRIIPHPTPPETAALNIAEAWVREPEDHHRRAALDFGLNGNSKLPATWMALAAGWSGGSLGPPQFPSVPPGPGQAARALRAGLLIALSRIAPTDKPRVMKLCLEDGMKLAQRKS